MKQAHDPIISKSRIKLSHDLRIIYCVTRLLSSQNIFELFCLKSIVCQGGLTILEKINRFSISVGNLDFLGKTKRYFFNGENMAVSLCMCVYVCFFSTKLGLISHPVSQLSHFYYIFEICMRIVFKISKIQKN